MYTEKWTDREKRVQVYGCVYSKNSMYMRLKVCRVNNVYSCDMYSNIVLTVFVVQSVQNMNSAHKMFIKIL